MESWRVFAEIAAFATGAGFILGVMASVAAVGLWEPDVDELEGCLGSLGGMVMAAIGFAGASWVAFSPMRAGGIHYMREGGWVLSTLVLCPLSMALAAAMSWVWQPAELPGGWVDRGFRSGVVGLLLLLPYFLVN